MRLAILKSLVYLEFLLLLRRSQEWLYPLAFFVIVTCLFPLALTPDPNFLMTFLPGCMWIAALLANLLGVENIFSTDLEEGYLEQLLLSQLPLTLLISIKLSVQWLMTTLPLLILIPLLGLLFHLSGTIIFILSLSLLLGTPILLLIGCLGVALTLGLRQPGMLLGLLILPLVTPVLIFGVTIVQQAQAGLSIVAPLAFLAGLMVFAMTLLPWVIATTLRMSAEE
ncbi:MAG TPA: heme exporter protein CcmB [Gammaproteobacteria bacterium]|jgi:heme exporter protein B|nr:heme exporter protein CcmB [Gammaproteobacteria bacterium]